MKAIMSRYIDSFSFSKTLRPSAAKTQSRKADGMNIVVVSTESLYPDPLASTVDQFAPPDSFHLQFGVQGPALAVSARALQDAVTHVSENLKVESGGICLGHVFR